MTKTFEENEQNCGLCEDMCAVSSEQDRPCGDIWGLSNLKEEAIKPVAKQHDEQQ